MIMKLFRGLIIGSWVITISAMASASEIACYSFNETSGTITHDSIGNVNGTLVGGVTFVPGGGIQGGAVDITTGYIDMGNNFPITSTFSVQAWVKIAIGDTQGMAAVAKHWQTLAQGYYLSINNAGDGDTKVNTVGFFSANGDPYQAAVGGTAIYDDQWHQLVGVYDNNTAYIYLDGVLVGTGLTGFSNNTADFIIGGDIRNGSPVNTFQGEISQVEIYDNALSPSDVHSLYESGITPEPSTILLFGSGLLGFMGYIRRKLA
jgi:hypothetical protein